MSTSDLTVHGWWVIAVLAGIALALSAASLVTTWPQRAAAMAVPAVTAPGIAGQSAARDYGTREALFLFTLLALTFSVLRLVFARWISLQQARRRAGAPVDANVGRQTAVFLTTFVVVLVAVAFLLG
ncbi:hypothetical protein ABZ135_22855 [Streptomyces sp. NPDC006339]|uniref:hypothetical protein n=1 Tax=Streptomyces sp. NPDC006339 TaxID=3156755 RepID=UPI0033B695D2